MLTITVVVVSRHDVANIQDRMGASYRFFAYIMCAVPCPNSRAAYRHDSPALENHRLPFEALFCVSYEHLSP